MLSIKMIRSRLESRLETLDRGARNLPFRLQTLRGTIDWSYDLLNKEEKTLFTRLSVFQGGRAIEAVEDVCAQGLSIQVMDGLESLVNKSLLYHEEGLDGEPRFLMLETIHEYAREKLTGRGEAVRMQRKHADFFARLAELAETRLAGDKQRHWFERLQSEHDNLRTALAFSLEGGLTEHGLRLVGALRDFWYYGGYVGEGLGWIESIMEGAGDAAPALRAKALNSGGWLSFLQGDYEKGREYSGEALALYRELGDEVNGAWALLFYGGQSAGGVGDLKEGIAMTGEALDIFRALNFKPGIIRSLNQFGELNRLDSDYERAGKAYEECIHFCRQTGDKLREAYALGNSGLVAQHQRDFERAEARIKNALTLLKDLNTKYPLAFYLSFLAGPASAQGNSKRAAVLLGASDALLKVMGLNLQPQDQPEIDRFSATVRDQLSDEDFKTAWEEGQALSLEDATAFALED
jgi:non-specific serine/threonine protein kinase